MRFPKYIAVVASSLYLAGCASFINGGPLESELAKRENESVSPIHYAKISGLSEAVIRQKFDPDGDGILTREDERNLSWAIGLQTILNEKAGKK